MNLTLKLKQTILTVSLIQNLLPLLPAALHLIYHNMIQPLGFPHFVSRRNLYQKLLMSLTLTKHMATIIKINLDDQVMQ